MGFLSRNNALSKTSGFPRSAGVDMTLQNPLTGDKGHPAIGAILSGKSVISNRYLPTSTASGLFFNIDAHAAGMPVSMRPRSIRSEKCWAAQPAGMPVLVNFTNYVASTFQILK